MLKHQAPGVQGSSTEQCTSCTALHAVHHIHGSSTAAQPHTYTRTREKSEFLTLVFDNQISQNLNLFRILQNSLQFFYADALLVGKNLAIFHHFELFSAISGQIKVLFQFNLISFQFQYC